MTTTKKMTKKDYFNILRESYPTTASNYNDVIAFIDHELELLSRKNVAERKPSKTQLANNNFRAQLVIEMEPNRIYTISEMIKTLPCCAEKTSNSLSGLLRSMYDKEFPENPNYPIKRLYEKRQAFFCLNSNYVTE